MGFESAINGFLSIETIILMIVLYFITAVFRKLVTQFLGPQLAKIWPDKWEGWWIMLWTNWILPVLPIVFGLLFAYFVPHYPYPEVFASSVSGKLCFGLVAGSFSSHAYRGFKSLIGKLIGNKAEEVTDKIEN